MGHIYLIRNLINGKGYVGQTVGSVEARFVRHKRYVSYGSNCPVHNAMRKYGVDRFTVETLCQAEDSRLNDLEKHYIKLLGTRWDAHGYNANDGGDSPSVVSLEARAKMSVAGRGRKQSADHIAKRSMCRVGTRLSKETRARISEALKGRKSPTEGKRLSQPTRDKIRMATIARHASKRLAPLDRET